VPCSTIANERTSTQSVQSNDDTDNPLHGLQPRLAKCAAAYSLMRSHRAQLTQKKRRRKTSMLSRLATTATPAAMKKKSPAAVQRLQVSYFWHPARADMQADHIDESRMLGGSYQRQERTELRLRVDLTAIQIEYAV